MQGYSQNHITLCFYYIFTAISPSSVSLRWNSTGITVAGTTGVCGSTADFLCNPYGLTFDSLSNALYIADNNNHRIQKWVLGATHGTTVAGNGTRGDGANQLSYPVHAIVDSNSNVYVSDSTNNRVQFWPNGAPSGVTIAGSSTVESANNQVLNPGFIARDPNTGALYIPSAYDRIVRWEPNATTGTVVAGGNGRGTTSTQFYHVFGLYFDSSSNSLYIGDYSAFIIVRWRLGATNWTLLAGTLTGMCGSTSTMLCYPTAITLDPMGNLYVADTNNQRIQLFLAGSNNGITIARVNFPGGIALDDELNLYVTEQYTHQVLKFTRL